MAVFGCVLFCCYFAVVFIVVVVFGFYVSGVGGGLRFSIHIIITIEQHEVLTPQWCNALCCSVV